MCGIFGHIGPISREIALACVEALAHRGPDARGLWEEGQVTLGHRRLSILDLTRQGNQPMSYAEGRYWITFNGEIYNFLELRAELETKGHRFLSDTDTEVILASFAEWGEGCQERFNGMWAFAIWDALEKMLFLSRDRFGKKPLFYVFLPTGFAFASEMKALFPMLQQIQYNTRLLRDSRRIMTYESTEECLIQGIKRFPGGHCGVLKDGRLTLRRWWCTLDHPVDIPMRYEEQVEQFQSLFLDACRLRMRSDVPVGTALSGGLDSSSIISAMAHIGRTDHSLRVSQDWQHAFVAGFPGTPLDESSYARSVAHHLGMEATLIDIDPQKAIDRIYDYLYLCEDIYITSPIPFMAVYGAMKDHRIKVTIDGHGADELFGGYAFDYVHALRDSGFHFSKVSMVLRTMYDAYPEDSDQFRLPPKWRTFLQYHGMQVAKKLLGRPVYSGPEVFHERWDQLGHLNRVLYASTHETVLPTLLRNYDRYSMSNGVEIRMPFLDYRIVCLAFSIPWTSKIRNGYAKAIIRDAMAPFMPREVAYRKGKIGFNSPTTDWIRGPLKTFFLDTIHSESFRTCDLINPTDVAARVHRVIEDSHPSFSMGERVWALLVPYLWEQAMEKRGFKSIT